MDDSIQTFLYIIISIIIIAVSALGRKKKPKPGVQGAPVEGEEETDGLNELADLPFFDKIKEQVLQEEAMQDSVEEELVVETYVPEGGLQDAIPVETDAAQAESVAPEGERYSNMPNRSWAEFSETIEENEIGPLEPAHMFIEQGIVNYDQEDDKPEIIVPLNALMEEFDLKKAVIYSEILNRKYD
jgi:hypothetical protein